MIRIAKGRWRLAPLVLLALALSGCAGGIEDPSGLLPVPTPEAALPFEAAASTDAPQGMSLVCERGALKLYVDKKTAAVAVRDGETNALYFSNPTDAAADALATRTEKGALASQIAVSYYNADQNEAVFYSANDAVSKDQFTVERIENGLRVTYTLGETRPLTNLMPRYIATERMQTLVYDHLSEDQVAYIAKRYIASTTHEGCLELPPTTRKSAIVAKKLAEYFTLAGYTWDDLEQDDAENGYQAADEMINIVVPVEYTLTDACFRARVVVESVVVSGNIQLSAIDLMPYFGAGGTADTGYIFVPAGSGALLRFNNGKQREAVYQQQIYGVDPLSLEYGRYQTSQPVRLPVFGIKRNDTAFLAVVSQGEAEGYITADVSGRKNGYNAACARFRLRDYEDISMTGSSGNENTMRVFEKNIYQGVLTVDYYFLPRDAGYSEMAGRYRALLVEHGSLTRRVSGENAPFFLTVVGAIEKTERVLGVPHEGMTVMTTYPQALDILRAIDEPGDLSVRMRYLGWFNGGVDHDVAKDIALTSQVGSKAELFALSDALTSRGGGLYPDVAFQYVYQTTDHYRSADEAARSVSGKVVNAALYLSAGMPSDYQNMGDRFYVNSPLALHAQIEGFSKDFRALSLGNLSLRDLGMALPSDQYAKRGVSRTLAEAIASREMDALKDLADKLLIADANAYALSFADELVNVPEDGAKFYILDESVPFYAMVTHGYVEYAGTPVNVRDDYDPTGDLLSMLENGCAPHFLLTYEETYKMNGSVYEMWHSTKYSDWLAECRLYADAYRDALLDVREEVIMRHDILENGLRVVTYENGTRLCVNYRERDAEFEGHAVSARGYLLLKGGAMQ